MTSRRPPARHRSRASSSSTNPTPRLFFGRDALTAELVERLGSGRFLAVVGASGSGKSSLARAGVVPAIRAQKDTDWAIHVLTPTARPLEALARGDDRRGRAVRHERLAA